MGLEDLITPVVAAGVTLKITEAMFPTKEVKSKRSKKKKTKKVGGLPGNFSNLGI